MPPMSYLMGLLIPAILLLRLHPFSGGLILLNAGCMDHIIMRSQRSAQAGFLAWETIA